MEENNINIEESMEGKEKQNKADLGWIITSIISFIMSGFMIYKGYDKFAHYYASETTTSLNVNAYVGGDAYNYIINSNYATGFYVLATLFAILGIGFLIIYYMKNNFTKEKE